MPTTLLKTKLYVPPVRPGLVPCPRLIERLHTDLRSGRKLTLLSAPADFGKTTLCRTLPPASPIPFCARCSP